MIKISNHINIFEVSRGAYESIYKNQGYFEVKSGAKQVSPVTIKHKTVVDEEMLQLELRELEEKPLPSWTKNEVKKYAECKNIDITGTKNVQEAKSIVKQYLAG